MRLSRHGFRGCPGEVALAASSACVGASPPPPACCADPSKKYPPTQARRGPWTPPPSPPCAAARRRRRRSSPRGTSFRWPSRRQQGRRRRGVCVGWRRRRRRRRRCRVRRCGLGVSSPPRGGAALRALRGRVASRRDSRLVEKGVGPSGAPDASGEFGKRRGRIERAIAVQVVGYIRFHVELGGEEEEAAGAAVAARARVEMARRRRGPPGRVVASIANTDELNDEKTTHRRRRPSSMRYSTTPRCSLVNTVHFFEGDPRGEEGRRGWTTSAGYVDVGEWSADSLVATQLASFRLATLRAFNVIHGVENARKNARDPPLKPPLERFGRRGGHVGYSTRWSRSAGLPVRPLPVRTWEARASSRCVWRWDGAATTRTRGRGRAAAAAAATPRSTSCGLRRRLGRPARMEELFWGLGSAGTRKIPSVEGLVDGSRDRRASRRRFRRLASALSRFYAPSTQPLCVSSRRRPGSSSRAEAEAEAGTIRIRGIRGTATIRIRIRRSDDSNSNSGMDRASPPRPW